MKARSVLLRYLAHAYLRSVQGAAATELALVVVLLTVPVLNVIDLGMYIYDRMELNNAAQAAVEAAFTTCASSSSNLPATVHCTSLSTADTAAAHSTTLGTNVSLGTPSENYYCLVDSVLTNVGPVSGTKPANCAANNSQGHAIGGSASEIPGDYIQITASYAYSSLFPGMSVAGLLTSPITMTAWMRLD